MRPGVTSPPPGQRLEAGQRDVVSNGQFQHEAQPLAVFRHIGNALAQGLADVTRRVGLAEEAHRAAVGSVDSGEQPGDLGAPGAHETCHAQDFAGMQGQIRAADSRMSTQPLGLECDRQGVGVRAVTVFGHVAAHHGADQGRAVKARGLARQYEPPVAQHRDAVGHREHLGHAMRDVNNADTVVPEPADDLEKAFFLGPSK